MRRENDIGCRQTIRYFHQGSHDHDVRVKINDFLFPILVKKQAEKRGFQGGAQLRDVVLKRKLVYIGQVELLKTDRANSRACLDITRQIVDDQEIEMRAAVMP